MKTILIVGGGAAGLAAAIAAADQNPRLGITVLDRMDRVGKKILATGNGRCNLTNENAAPAYYETTQPQALIECFSGMKPETVLRFFRRLGLFCTTEEEGRVYPYCRQASMVLDILLRAAEQRGIRLETGCVVRHIRYEGDRFAVFADNRNVYYADRVILSAGGCASPKLGSDGSGFSLARELGLALAAPYPALVPLLCAEKQMAGLKGIRAEGSVTLLAGKRLLGQQRGEIQFTEHGLSGIPVMQLSGKLAGAKAETPKCSLVDLLPDLPEEALAQELLQRKKRMGTDPAELLLLGIVHKRLGFAVMKTAGISPLSRPIGALSEAELRRLAMTMKRWPFPVTGTQGFENAQVTGGGVLLSEVHARTMESRRQKGLFLAGEMLDVTGQCGGYNLHWAWCSGIRAGRAAAKEESR